jgi:quercetin dioxygenase-like cupin family protein
VTLDLPLVLSLATTQLHGSARFEPFRPGIEIASLYREGRGGASAAFLRYAPGASVPLHRHLGFEHVLVLEGAQRDDRGHYGVGTLVVNPPGTSHRVWSPEGCLVLVIWQRPVVFVRESVEARSSEKELRDTSASRLGHDDETPIRR